jgi:hypothetical protein
MPWRRRHVKRILKGSGTHFKELVLMNAQKAVKCFSVIPTEAGIEVLCALTGSLEPGFHLGDDFLRNSEF